MTSKTITHQEILEKLGGEIFMLPDSGPAELTPYNPPPLERITLNEMMMQVAEVVAQRATCNRKKVGAVLAKDGRALSHGYNGSQVGARHCGSECYSGGPRCASSIHAEANAIIWAARVGVSIQGATAYTTLSPCEGCAALLVNSGITRLFFREFYRGSKGNDLLESAGIPVRQLGMT